MKMVPNGVLGDVHNHLGVAVNAKQNAMLKGGRRLTEVTACAVHAQRWYSENGTDRRSRMFARRCPTWWRTAALLKPQRGGKTVCLYAEKGAFASSDNVVIML